MSMADWRRLSERVLVLQCGNIGSLLEVPVTD